MNENKAAGDGTQDNFPAEPDVGKKTDVEYGNVQYSATTLTFYPFVDDEYLRGNALLKQAKFSIKLSDDVPGGLVSLQVSASAENEIFNRTLSLM